MKREFFEQPTTQVARGLLGQRLVLISPHDRRLSGLITEVEAYVGREDLACHARVGKTKRNAAMWGPAGHLYVFFTYGVHWMLNFVTEGDGFPAAVLIRGMWPQEGLEEMFMNRPVAGIEGLANGPAKLCQALGIEGSWDGVDMCSDNACLFVEKTTAVDDSFVTTSPRVGLNNVPEPWKSKPWRYQVDPVIFIRGEVEK